MPTASIRSPKNGTSSKILLRNLCACAMVFVPEDYLYPRPGSLLPTGCEFSCTTHQSAAANYSSQFNRVFEILNSNLKGSDHLCNKEKIFFKIPLARKRAIITAQIAREIFSFKSPLRSSRFDFDTKRTASSGQRSGDSVVFAEIYGISPKAVRDIWNG